MNNEISVWNQTMLCLNLVYLDDDILCDDCTKTRHQIDNKSVCFMDINDNREMRSAI